MSHSDDLALVTACRDALATVVSIDPNVRTRGGTFTGFEDVTGRITASIDVTVIEPESDLIGRGRITDIDRDKRIVYLTVDWSSLHIGKDPQAITRAALSLIEDTLNRHKPDTMAPLFCEWCYAENGDWPCADYLAATAALHTIATALGIEVPA